MRCRMEQKARKMAISNMCELVKVKPKKRVKRSAFILDGVFDLVIITFLAVGEKEINLNLRFF